MDNQKWCLCFISLAFLFITSSADELLIQQVTEGRGTEYNSSHSLGLNLGVTRELREERPSSKILTITSCSTLTWSGVSFESSIFEAAGYKWRLVLYMVGKQDDGGKDHFSLYVRIEDTGSLLNGWEVIVDLKLFVHNPNLHKYLVVTDGTVKRYNNAKKEWGYGQLIPHSTFYNPSEGYIRDDTCGFGAEILIMKPPAEKQEKVTFISNPPNNVFVYKLLGFSQVTDTFYSSGEHLIGDRYWYIGFWPGDITQKQRGFTLYLFALGYRPNAVASNTWGEVNLRLKNQRSSNHKQIHIAASYPTWWGFGVGGSIIELSDLLDPSKGYLMNDAVIFEAEIVKTSVTNIISA